MNRFIQLMQATTLGRFLLPAGIAFLIFGIVSMGVKDARNFVEVSAVISKTELVQEEYVENGTRHDAEYEVYVKYTVGGREYESELGVLAGNVKVGDPMKVFYNPEDPGEVVQMRNQALIPYIAIGVGALALIGGIISVVKAMQKIKRLREQEEEWSYGN